MPVTLAECEELAPSEGEGRGWVLAARYAARMLPQVFRPDDPVLAVGFAREHQKKLEDLLAGLAPAVFTAGDSLGWVYQFWQAKKKDEVNKGEKRIGADEIAPVTQLFTEHYMVLFLLHNTLGAWWAGRNAGKLKVAPLPEDATPDQRRAFEDDLRRRLADTLPALAGDAYTFDYLRFLPDGTPAAGTFDGWPGNPEELRVIDPCMGSGHFVVAVLDLLARIRMAAGGLSARDAVDAVLRDNLFGLEIDERCTQIAAFALALAAWTFPGAGGYRPLPPLKLACCGIPIAAKRAQWLALAGGDERLEQGMDQLYTLFENAPTLGSLINPRDAHGDLFVADAAELRKLLRKALAKEKKRSDHAEDELGVAAGGGRCHQSRRSPWPRVPSGHHQCAVPWPRQAGRRPARPHRITVQ